MPSRAVLFTGRHHIGAGVYSWISDAGPRSHLDGPDISPLFKPDAGRAFTRQQPLFWHLPSSR